MRRGRSAEQTRPGHPARSDQERRSCHPSTDGSRRRSTLRGCDRGRSSPAWRPPPGESGGTSCNSCWTVGKPSSAKPRAAERHSVGSATWASPNRSCDGPACRAGGAAANAVAGRLWAGLAGIADGEPDGCTWWTLLPGCRDLGVHNPRVVKGLARWVRDDVTRLQAISSDRCQRVAQREAAVLTDRQGRRSWAWCRRPGSRAGCRRRRWRRRWRRRLRRLCSRVRRTKATATRSSSPPWPGTAG